MNLCCCVVSNKPGSTYFKIVKWILILNFIIQLIFFIQSNWNDIEKLIDALGNDKVAEKRDVCKLLNFPLNTECSVHERELHFWLIVIAFVILTYIAMPIGVYVENDFVVWILNCFLFYARIMFVVLPISLSNYQNPYSISVKIIDGIYMIGLTGYYAYLIDSEGGSAYTYSCCNV